MTRCEATFRVALSHDPMEPELPESQPKHLPGTLGGQAASLEVRVDAPADLALTTLGARQADHELTDIALGLGIDGGDQNPIAVRLDPGLLQSPLEQGARRVDVHRLPEQVAGHVLPAEQVMDRRQIADLVRPERHPCRRERVGGFEHPGAGDDGRRSGARRPRYASR